MHENNEKISEFANALRRLIDDTGIFSRQEWADFLDVSEPAISQWVHDQTLPRAEVLRRIVGLVKSSSRVPEDILAEFDFISTKPASNVSPHGKRIGESIKAYLINPLLKGFLAGLARLEPDVQEKLLLRFSRMCTEAAGVFKSDNPPVLQNEAVKATWDSAMYDIDYQAVNKMEVPRPCLSLLKRNNQAAIESPKSIVEEIEGKVPQFLSQMALYLVGSDEESVFPFIRLFCTEALEHVNSHNNTSPLVITKHLLGSVKGIELFSFEHTKQALNLLFLLADKVSVLIEDDQGFALLDYVFEGSFEDAIYVVQILGNRNVQYKLTERVSDSYQRVIVKDGSLSRPTRSDDVKAA